MNETKPSDARVTNYYLHVIDIQDIDFIDALRTLCDSNLSWKELAHKLCIVKEYASVSVYDLDEKLIYKESTFEPYFDSELYHIRIQYRDSSSEPSDVEICIVYRI